jgi:hypothetical protein
MMVTAIETKKASPSSGTIPRIVVAAASRTGLKSRDRCGDDGLAERPARLALDVDLLDQHDAVLDQHAGEAQQAQQAR